MTAARALIDRLVFDWDKATATVADESYDETKERQEQGDDYQSLAVGLALKPDTATVNGRLCCQEHRLCRRGIEGNQPCVQFSR